MAKNKRELTKEDLDLLYVGQVFSSYKDLYTLLGLEFSSGNFRKSARRTVDQYLALEKTGKGREIRISEIYDEPKERSDKRHEKPFELEREFEILLCNFLNSQEDNNHVLTKNNLFSALFCYSFDMHDHFVTDHEEVASEFYDVSDLIFRKFKSDMQTVCRENVLPRLDRYKSKNSIFYSPIFMVDGVKCYPTETRYHAIKKEKENLLEKLGLTSFLISINAAHRRKFSTELQKILSEKYKIQVCYEALELRNIDFSVEYTEDEFAAAKDQWNRFICGKVLALYKKQVKNTEKNNNIAEELMFKDKSDLTEADEKAMKKYFQHHESQDKDFGKLINRCIISGPNLVLEEVESFYIPENMKADNNKEADESDTKSE